MDWTVETAGKIMNAQGRVEKVQIDVGDKKELFHWGDVAAIMKARRVVDVLWLEFREEAGAVDDDVIAVVSTGARQPGGLRVIAYGPTDVMQKLCEGAMGKLFDAAGPLAGYKVKQLAVFLPKDPLFGDRQPGFLEVMRTVVLISPTTIKPSMQCVRGLIPWSPAVLVYLVALLDLHCCGL